MYNMSWHVERNMESIVCFCVLICMLTISVMLLTYGGKQTVCDKGWGALWTRVYHSNRTIVVSRQWAAGSSGHKGHDGFNMMCVSVRYV